MNASKQIDIYIAALPEWQRTLMTMIRKTVHDVAPQVVEEWKWMGTPCWNHEGLVCAADAHKHIVKIIFFKGASLPDPDSLFNGELTGKVRRAIKLAEGDKLDSRAFKRLVKAAAELNASKSRQPMKTAGTRRTQSRS